MPEEWPELLGPAFDGEAGRAACEAVAEVDAQRFRPGRSETPVATVARMETVGYLQGQLLRDIDAVSMAHGLEVRVPFVDHRLAAAVWPAVGHLPTSLRRKRLLRDSLPMLPGEIARRPKRGFTLPFDTWMRGGLRETSVLGVAASVSQGWVSARAAAALWADWEQGRAHWSRVWSLVVLGQFLQEAA